MARDGAGCSRPDADVRHRVAGSEPVVGPPEANLQS